MTFFQRQYRKRLSLMLALGILVGYYAFVFRPLLLRERAQLEPFEQLQMEMEKYAENNPAVAGLAVGQLINLENMLQNSIAMTASARDYIVDRFAPEPEIAMNIERAWQLVDYQNERLQRQLALGEMAKQRGVDIKVSVVAGLPELRSDTQRKELLWAQLGLVDAILRSAVAVGVDTLDDVQVPTPIFHPPAYGESVQLVEVPMRVHVSGTWADISQFLGTVLLDEAGRKALGLPPMEGLPGMNLRRIIARKAPPEGASTIRLEVEFSGFVEMPVESIE